MAQAYEVYFFLKMVDKKTAKKPWKLTTTMWEWGPGKNVKIDVSKSLGSAGPLAPDMYFDIFPVRDPDIDEAGARAMLTDPTFTWKDDAAVITLHRVRISMS